MQVQRIACEAIKQGYQEGEKQISRETILNVIMPDFRDLRTELRRKGYTTRDNGNSGTQKFVRFPPCPAELIDQRFVI
jgi:hypothetical protein